MIIHIIICSQKSCAFVICDQKHGNNIILFLYDDMRDSARAGQ